MFFSKKKLIHIFIALMLLELFLMGSGRPLMLGSFSVRMLFFFVAIFMMLYCVIVNRCNLLIDEASFMYLYVFIFISLIASFIGLANGADLSKVLSDLSPLMYFILVVFFGYLAKKDNDFINLWVKILKISAIFLSVGYISFLILLYFNFFDFHFVYALLSSDSNEVMFRGDSSSSPGLFYKSFIFLVIGFFFFYFDKKAISKTASFIIFLAIVLTFTRGFILSTVVVLYLVQFIKLKIIHRILYVSLPCAIVFVVLLQINSQYFEFAQRADSDDARMIQIEEVLNMANTSSIIVGHGFGIGVKSRPDHFEITYLEILHKQGILGLCFWIMLLLHASVKFIKLKDEFPMVYPIYAGVLAIYIQTATNPYLINSMGMGYLMLAFVSLNVIDKYSNMRVDYVK